MESNPSRTATQLNANNRGASWALALLILAAIGVATSLLLVFRDPSGSNGGGAAAPEDESNWAAAPAPVGETVALTVDFGNGARREFDALPWRPGMTVGDLLRQAREFSPPLAFTQQGAGETAFLTSLEGVANETGAGRYWLYRIDDRRGDKSFDVAPLAAGERVLWRFGQAE